MEHIASKSAKKFNKKLALVLLFLIIIVSVFLYFNIMWPGVIYQAKPSMLQGYDPIEVVNKAIERDYAIRLDLSSAFCTKRSQNTCLGIGVTAGDYEYINLKVPSEYSNRSLNEFDYLTIDGIWSNYPKNIYIENTIKKIEFNLDDGSTVSFGSTTFFGALVGYKAPRLMLKLEISNLINKELRRLSITKNDIPINFDYAVEDNLKMDPILK